MFAPTTLSGKPLDYSYARTRSQWEPLLEITQIKGDSEAHPLLSPEDGFSDFETVSSEKIFGVFHKSAPHDKRYNYARSGLKQGLLHQRILGKNPFKFGVIGSTDAHTSLFSPIPWCKHPKANCRAKPQARITKSVFSKASPMRCHRSVIATKDKNQGPLERLNVIDFDHYYTGPMVGMLLVDQGANVIRIVRLGEKELQDQ